MAMPTANPQKMVQMGKRGYFVSIVKVNGTDVSIRSLLTHCWGEGG